MESKTYLIEYSSEALKKLEHLSLSSFTSKSAHKALVSIRKNIKSLESFPFGYPIIDQEPWKSMELRKMVIGKYKVIYKVNQLYKKVEIYNIVSERENVYYTERALMNDKPRLFNNLSF